MSASSHRRSALRFSPAPTGFLHIGNVRTALFNWLHARHTGGTFILRIEDTDVARSTQESIEQIQQVMRWVGLDWDEGPYPAEPPLRPYLAAAAAAARRGRRLRVLLHRGRGARRATKQAMKRGPPAGLRRSLPRSHAPSNAPHASPRAGRASVRFRTPDEGRSTFVDVVRGEVSVEWSTISDFVIVRSNGTPVFFLANAVDDVDMGITHVLRGEDLIDSTHRVLALRRALGARRSARVRAHAADPRPGRREALEAARRGVGRGVPRRRLPARTRS